MSVYLSLYRNHKYQKINNQSGIPLFNYLDYYFGTNKKCQLFSLQQDVYYNRDSNNGSNSDSDIIIEFHPYTDYYVSLHINHSTFRKMDYLLQEMLINHQKVTKYEKLLIADPTHRKLKLQKVLTFYFQLPKNIVTIKII